MLSSLLVHGRPFSCEERILPEASTSTVKVESLLQNAVPKVTIEG